MATYSCHRIHCTAFTTMQLGKSRSTVKKITVVRNSALGESFHAPWESNHARWFATWQTDLSTCELTCQADNSPSHAPWDAAFTLRSTLKICIRYQPDFLFKTFLIFDKSFLMPPRTLFPNSFSKIIYFVGIFRFWKPWTPALRTAIYDFNDLKLEFVVKSRPSGLF